MTKKRNKKTIHVELEPDEHKETVIKATQSGVKIAPLVRFFLKLFRDDDEAASYIADEYKSQKGQDDE